MIRVLAAGAALALTLWATSGLAQAPTAPALPDWWTAHVAFMSSGSGAWVTPNPAGESDPNVPDAFGMEWRAVNEGHGLVGRLYGIEAGREVAEYWTFREFYHPGERRFVLEQWGGPGVYGVGETTSPARDRGEVAQTFWLPDGRSWREGHRTHENGDEYLTEAYDIGADGQWALSNSNTWRRIARGQGSSSREAP